MQEVRERIEEALSVFWLFGPGYAKSLPHTAKTYDVLAEFRRVYPSLDFRLSVPTSGKQAKLVLTIAAKT